MPGGRRTRLALAALGIFGRRCPDAAATFPALMSFPCCPRQIQDLGVPVGFAGDSPATRGIWWSARAKPAARAGVWLVTSVVWALLHTMNALFGQSVRATWHRSAPSGGSHGLAMTSTPITRRATAGHDTTGSGRGDCHGRVTPTSIR